MLNFPAEGSCTCRAVRYRMASAPLIVHACHCTWCQRETGTAFALNAMIETDRVEHLSGMREHVNTPTLSGKGQVIVRCPNCRVAVYSHYAGWGALAAFVRVGTLDSPELCPPDVHIFTSTKQPWLKLAESQRAVHEYYRTEEVWTPASLVRREALKAKQTALKG